MSENMVRNSVAIFLLMAVTTPALAADSRPPAASGVAPTPADDSEEAVIPKAPSAPPRLLAPKSKEGFQCDRFFTYKGRTVTCDSDVRRDAESLRTVVRDVPAAVAELDKYDYNREHIKSMAYVGSAGLLIGILGAVLASRISSQNSASIRNISVISGLAITAGSFIYASGVMRTNEAHIGNAVADFNAVHPESPIELQFSTGITF